LQKDDAKEAHWSKHGDPETAGGRNGGAHWAYLSGVLKRNSAGSGFVVGSQLSVADIALADLSFNYLRNFEAGMKASYPEIVEHNTMVFAQEKIQSYVASGKQFDKVNNNGLG
jgi:glutathione S-transferase P